MRKVHDFVLDCWGLALALPGTGKSLIFLLHSVIYTNLQSVQYNSILLIILYQLNTLQLMYSLPWRDLWFLWLTGEVSGPLVP